MYGGWVSFVYPIARPGTFFRQESPKTGRGFPGGCFGPSMARTPWFSCQKSAGIDQSGVENSDRDRVQAVAGGYYGTGKRHTLFNGFADFTSVEYRYRDMFLMNNCGQP